jgi:hypothetical protein
MGGLSQQQYDVVTVPPPVDDAAADTDSELSSAEQLELQDQIDALVAQDRLTITPSTLRFTPQHRGSRLPVAVNIVALLLLSAGILLLWHAFDRGEQELVGASATVELAEGRLLEAFREQAAEEMAGKNREIATIQDRLERANRERELARAQAQAELTERRQALEEELALSLEAERRRLVEQGVASEEIERRMQAMQTQQQEQFDAQMQEIQRELQEVFQARETELVGRIQSYEQTLEATQAEQEELRDRIAAREAQLATTATEQQALVQELEARRRAELVLDQVQASYGQIQTRMQANELDQALAGVQTLREFLSQPIVTSVPSVADGLQVERFLLDAVESQLRAEMAPEAPTLRIQSPLAGVSPLIDRGQAALDAGQLTRARELYLAALQEVPEIWEAYSRLRQIRDQLEQETRAAWTRRVQEGDAAFQAGDLEDAARHYLAAAQLLPAGEALWTGVLEGMREIGYRRGAEETRAPLEARIQALTAELASDRARVEELRDRIAEAGSALRKEALEAQTAGTVEGLVALLQLKLELRRLLRGADLTDAYTRFIRDAEAAITRFEAEARQDARAEALDRAAELLPVQEGVE